MATSPNYGWLEPDNTDLVKNGALSIRTLGNAIDTTMATMTPKAIVDAKGDLIAATADNTPARLAVGNNGETLVADSSTSTGLRYQGNFAAGKNKVLNSDFSIAQRGTSIALAFGFKYGLDRWCMNTDSSPTGTVTQATFTPGTAPVAGYEGQYFYNFNATAMTGGTFYDMAINRIEDVRTFAGQTVTVSFWAKADSTRTISMFFNQNFGSGGSGDVNTTITSSQTLTTSWVRYSMTVAVPSVSGKTIGTSSFNGLTFRLGSLVAQTISLWGVQIEASNTATAFQTATGTIQGELAACQRYYWRSVTDGAAFKMLANGISTSASGAIASFPISLPVPMRVYPTSFDFANIAANKNSTDTRYTSGTWSIANNGTTLSGGNSIVEIFYTHGSGVFTAGSTNTIQTTSATGQYMGVSAEL
jgi:hypothetical protein